MKRFNRVHYLGALTFILIALMIVEVYMNKADRIIEQLASEQEAIEAINKIALAFCIDVDVYEEV